MEGLRSRRPRTIAWNGAFVAVGSALCLLPPCAANATSEAGQALLRDLGPDFALHRSEHFVVAYAPGGFEAAAYRAQILESLHVTLLRFFRTRGLPLATPEPATSRSAASTQRPLSVALFPSQEAFLAFLPHLALPDVTEGIYLHEPNYAVFFDSTNRAEAREAARRAREIASELAALRREVAAAPEGKRLRLDRLGDGGTRARSGTRFARSTNGRGASRTPRVAIARSSGNSVWRRCSTRGRI